MCNKETAVVDQDATKYKILTYTASSYLMIFENQYIVFKLLKISLFMNIKSKDKLTLKMSLNYIQFEVEWLVDNV